MPLQAICSRGYMFSQCLSHCSSHANSGSIKIIACILQLAT